MTTDPVFPRSAPGPLEGVIIADFSRVLAGPYCTMLLGDMGATIIKVESPTGDDSRSWKPPVREDEAIYFLAVNRNKHSVVLDFDNPDDLKTAHELIERSDVMVENFKTGSLARHGLDYATLGPKLPQLIYTSITGFGPQAGDGLAGYDLAVQALSGLMSVNGGPETEPFRVGVAVIDVLTGLHAAIGILGALHHRSETGRGQLLELNLLTSALSGMVNQTAAWVAGGVVPQRMGNEHPSLYPYEPLPTADGTLIVAAGNNAQFSKLCDILLIPDVANDPRFATPLLRSLNRVELRPILTERLASQTAAQWFDTFNAAGLVSAPIHDVRQGVEFAEKIGLEPVVVAGTSERSIPTLRHPVKYSLTPANYDLSPPELGGSTAALRQWLKTTQRANQEEEHGPA